MKKIIYMFLSLLVIGMLAACGDTNENQEELNSDEENEEVEEEVNEDGKSTDTDDQAETEEPETNEETANNSSEDATSPENGNEAIKEEAVETITEEVTFIGLADPHTIEVETEDETIALQILDFMDDDWESIEMGTTMTIEYYKNEHNQLILTDYTIE